MAIFLLPGSADPKVRSVIKSELLATIPSLTEASSFDWVFEQESVKNNAELAIILVVTASGDRHYFDRMIEAAAQHKDEAFLILISDEISASDYKRLVRTGAADLGIIQSWLERGDRHHRPLAAASAHT